jgi:hypothetical protein
MIHPHTELRQVSPEIGLGVFATQEIPKGTMLYVWDALERVVCPGDPMLEDPKYFEVIDKYSYVGPDGCYVISWDLAKYVNHSCRANSLSTGYGFEIAVCDIAPGEQITDDYGMLNIAREMICLCGAADCRGRIRPDDLDRQARRWDRVVRDALACFPRVDQPLACFLDDELRADLCRYLRDRRGYRSVRRLRCRADAIPAEMKLLEQG